jgi:FkbM family methyltransferase
MLRLVKDGVGTALGEVMAGLMVSIPSVDRWTAALLRKHGRRPILRSVSMRTLTALRRRAKHQRLVRIASLPHDGRLLVDLRDVSGALYFDPTAIEPVTVEYVVKHLGRGDVFIDVGANIGYYTLIIGSILRKLGGGHVYAFEPNPAPYRLLAESVDVTELASIVSAFPVAIGRGDRDTVDLYLADEGNSALSATEPWPQHLESGALSANVRVSVPCRSLDSFVEEQGIARIDWLKIDVETAEMSVLEGMTSVLERVPPARIVCETSLQGEVASRLRSKGYSSRMLELIDPQRQDWGNVLFERSS